MHGRSVCRSRSYRRIGVKIERNGAIWCMRRFGRVAIGAGRGGDGDGPEGGEYEELGDEVAFGV